MKKLLKIGIIFLFLILIKLLLSFTLNKILIKEYNRGNYKKDYVKVLKLLNTNERYIVYYNEGNILYQEEKYDEAINNYKKALEKNPPKKKACDIRINLSITYIQNIKSTNKQVILEELKNARENLYNDHCADPEDNSGRSKEAESLEEIIKEMEEELESNSGNQNGNSTSEEEEEDDDQSLEEELQEINKDAKASRETQLEDYKNLGNYQYYSGKSW